MSMQAEIDRAGEVNSPWNAARRLEPLRFAADEARRGYLVQVARRQAAVARMYPDLPSAEAVAELRAVRLETIAFLSALAALTYADMPAVEAMFNGGHRSLTDAARPIFERHPALLAWHARRQAVADAEDARAAERAEALRAEQAAADAERERQAPARLLQALRARGITLQLGAHGKTLLAFPVARLTLDETAEIKRHKAELLALLADEERDMRPAMVA